MSSGSVPLYGGDDDTVPPSARPRDPDFYKHPSLPTVGNPNASGYISSHNSSKTSRFYPCGPSNASNKTVIENSAINRAETKSAKLVYDKSTHAHRGSIGEPITNGIPNFIERVRSGSHWYERKSDHTGQAEIVENVGAFHPEKALDDDFSVLGDLIYATFGRILDIANTDKYYYKFQIVVGKKDNPNVVDLFYNSKTRKVSFDNPVRSSPPHVFHSEKDRNRDSGIYLHSTHALNLIVIAVYRWEPLAPVPNFYRVWPESMHKSENGFAAEVDVVLPFMNSYDLYDTLMEYQKQYRKKDMVLVRLFSRVLGTLDAYGTGDLDKINAGTVGLMNALARSNSPIDVIRRMASLFVRAQNEYYDLINNFDYENSCPVSNSVVADDRIRKTALNFLTPYYFYLHAPNQVIARMLEMLYEVQVIDIFIALLGSNECLQLSHCLMNTRYHSIPPFVGIENDVINPLLLVVKKEYVKRKRPAQPIRRPPAFPHPFLFGKSSSMYEGVKVRSPLKRFNLVRERRRGRMARDLRAVLPGSYDATMEFIKGNLGVQDAGDVDILSNLGRSNNSSERPILAGGNGGYSNHNNDKNKCNDEKSDVQLGGLGHTYNKYGKLVSLAKYRQNILGKIHEETEDSCNSNGNGNYNGNQRNNNSNNNNQNNNRYSGYNSGMHKKMDRYGNKNKIKRRNINVRKSGKSKGNDGKRSKNGKNGKNDKNEINTNSIYSSIYGVGNYRNDRMLSSFDGYNSDSVVGRSSLGCVALGNDRYRNFNQFGKKKKKKYGSDVSVTTGIARRNRFWLGRRVHSNRSQLSISLNQCYNFRHSDHVDRFLFPPRDPYYLPPVEKPVPGRHIDWFIPVMDSGWETMDNETTFMIKGIVPLARAGMKLKLTGCDVNLVLDTAFERENVEYAARDPTMDRLFPPYISDTECERVYSIESDELIHDENYRKLLFETWDNFPNTKCLRGMPHQYGLQYSSVPKNSGRKVMHSINSQNQSFKNSNNGSLNKARDNMNDDNKIKSDNIERKDNIRDEEKKGSFGSQKVKKEEKGVKEVKEQQSEEKRRQVYRFVSMRGQITRVSVSDQSEKDKSDKGDGKESKSKVPIFQQVEASQEKKDKEQGGSVVSGSIAATMVIDSDEHEETGDLKVEDGLYLRQSGSEVRQELASYQKRMVRNDNMDVSNEELSFDDNGKGKEQQKDFMVAQVNLSCKQDKMLKDRDSDDDNAGGACDGIALE